jgi:hypothetical protein
MLHRNMAVDARPNAECQYFLCSATNDLMERMSDFGGICQAWREEPGPNALLIEQIPVHQHWTEQRRAP